MRRLISIFASILVIGCASPNSQDFAQNVWGGTPVTPTCNGDKRGLDWTNLKINNLSYTRFYETPIRLKIGDTLQYNLKNSSIEVKIRKPVQDEPPGSFGYVFEYTETSNDKTISGAIPLQSEGVNNVEMCGGIVEKFKSSCQADFEVIKESLSDHLYQTNSRNLQYTLESYKSRILPDYIFTRKTYPTHNQGRQILKQATNQKNSNPMLDARGNPIMSPTYRTLSAEPLFTCGLKTKITDTLNELGEKHWVCYRRTGNLCERT